MSDTAGLYIHIPFCSRKCPYCDFYSSTDVNLIPDFLKALFSEMRLRSGALPAYDTIYLGGGTPSLLSIDNISQIIENAYRLFNVASDAEITVEVNPGTISLDKLKGYRSAGINRINIGVQSFEDENLKFLGRIHSSKETIYSIKSARKAGFDNLGIDLIYGIPGQDRKTWLPDLNTAVESGAEHLSCYILTYESGTKMDMERRRKKFKPLSDKLITDLFETTINFFSIKGYYQYEISNFALSEKNSTINRQSKHNIKYWLSIPYTGLGPSAHSFENGIRFWNFSDTLKYIKITAKGNVPVEKREFLSEEQQIIEAIYLGLRRTEGIDTNFFDKKFSVKFNNKFKSVILFLQTRGLLKVDKNRCALTKKGMIFHESITAMFL